jgi:alpha-N-acetylglucosamine transferase
MRRLAVAIAAEGPKSEKLLCRWVKENEAKQAVLSLDNIRKALVEDDIPTAVINRMMDIKCSSILASEIITKYQLYQGSLFDKIIEIIDKEDISQLDQVDMVQAIHSSDDDPAEVIKKVAEGEIELGSYEQQLAKFKATKTPQI